MKVTHSSLDLSSFYSATEVSVETTQMRLQAVMPAGEQPSPLGDSGAPAETVSRMVEDEVNVSERARTLLAERLAYRGTHLAARAARRV